jgi:CubicO group peptidase (beta-lactamase class C family)
MPASGNNARRGYAPPTTRSTTDLISAWKSVVCNWTRCKRAVWICTAALLTCRSGLPNAASKETVEQHVQTVAQSLLPPVIIKGEVVHTETLADRMLALHVPGVSIAVIHKGKIEWARGFGVSRIGGPPVTADTLFQAASISKSVSALAVLRLVQTGKLRLDEDVNHYLTSWKIPSNTFTNQAKVTLRQLLAHSAGVTIGGSPGFEAGALTPTLLQILNGEPPATNPPVRIDRVPGTIRRYSNEDYDIAQQVVVDITGTPFPELMQQLVLRPLGMLHSSYDQPLAAKQRLRAATPYRGDGAPIIGGPRTYVELAAAGLWTTPSDLARYALGVHEALAGRSTKVIAAATAREMLSPGLQNQGLGPVVGGSTSRLYFTHTGGAEGYRCILVAYEDGQDGAVILTNGDNGNPLDDKILRTIAHDYHWPDFAPLERTFTNIDPRTFDRYVGAYRLDSGRILTVWRDGDHLHMRLRGDLGFDIVPIGDREYFVKTLDGRLLFDGGANEATRSVTLFQAGQQVSGRRLSDDDAKVFVRESLDVEMRIKTQTPRPDSATKLKLFLTELLEGKPNYQDMSAAFAETTRAELTQVQSRLKSFGPLQTISFKSVAANGADVYDVAFQSVVKECRISLLSDGRIDAVGF